MVLMRPVSMVPDNLEGIPTAGQRYDQGQRRGVGPPEPFFRMRNGACLTPPSSTGRRAEAMPHHPGPDRNSLPSSVP